jgi:rhomboid protease GluP
MSEERDWVDRVVKVGGALGLNEVKLRFKLQRFQRQREQARRRREQRREHVQYQHKTCDACGAVQDRDERVCGRCGEPLSSRRRQVIRRIGLSMPQLASVSTLLGIAIVIVYVRLTIAAGGAGDLFNLPIRTLYEFGGHFAPAVAAGEWWRWVTAIFLHAGIWHIGFNLLALSVIGPRVEELYGRLMTPLLFMTTGALASIGSGLASPDGLGVGASGAIMGLVGVAAGWGQRQGTTPGKELRNDMLKWSVYVFFFGFLIGADNWAHLFGLLSGAAVGYLVSPELLRRPAARPLVTVLAGIGILAAAGTFLLVMSRPG